MAVNVQVCKYPVSSIQCQCQLKRLSQLSLVLEIENWPLTHFHTCILPVSRRRHVVGIRHHWCPRHGIPFVRHRLCHNCLLARDWPCHSSRRCRRERDFGGGRNVFPAVAALPCARRKPRLLLRLSGLLLLRLPALQLFALLFQLPPQLTRLLPSAVYRRSPRMPVLPPAPPFSMEVSRTGLRTPPRP